MTDPGLKKVLILTYYWPPSGGAGVQRWLKFTKYLRDFKFEPVIYTAEDPEYPSIDDSLMDDIPENITVLKTRVREPYKLYKLFTSKKKGHRINTGFLNEEKKKGLPEKISVWIRGNWFIPDARKFWITPSSRYLVRYLGENPVDLIVSTGPPHSLHLIALHVAGKTGLPWVADFRDPWTKIDYYRDLHLTRRSDRKHRELEKKVVCTADALTVINREMKEQFKEIGGKNIHVITNGFDPEDYDPDTVTERDNKFSLTHIGTIVPTRNPVKLWKVLSELVQENADFAKDLEIKLVGASDYSVTKSIAESGLDNRVVKIDYLPHKEAIRVLKSSQVLLLLVNNTPHSKGILTGKLFEYLNAGRPILAIGPSQGEVEYVLEETSTGRLADFNDGETLKKLILEYYQSYRENKLEINSRNIDNYSRKTLTGKISGIFNEIIKSQ
jgi:glycosyltransferase involved in cell wall biosynthesis